MIFQDKLLSNSQKSKNFRVFSTFHETKIFFLLSWIQIKFFLDIANQISVIFLTLPVIMCSEVNYLQENTYLPFVLVLCQNSPVVWLIMMLNDQWLPIKHINYDFISFSRVLDFLRIFCFENWKYHWKNARSSEDTLFKEATLPI